MNVQKALVLTSGGIDSMACAHFLSKNFDVSGLFIDYGQAALRHEKISVGLLSQILGIKIRYSTIGLGENYGTGEIVGRNMLLIASALASGIEKSLICIGIHSGTPYYDCTDMFIDRMNSLVQECTSGRVQLIAPFSQWEKPQIYDYCRKEGLDLSITYSCEAGSMPPCGLCASCLDRKLLDASQKAFY